MNMDYRAEMNKLLEPTSVMVFDATENVSFTIEPFIKGPTKGLYYGAGLLPVLIDGQEYFHGFDDNKEAVRPINGTSWTVEDVRKWLKTGLRTKQDTPVFSSNPRYIHAAFRQKPVANINLVKFIQLWVKNYLTSLSPYASRGNTETKMVDLLIDQDSVYEKFFSGEIDRYLEPLSCQIAAWVGRDVWHMYSVRAKHTSITIEKAADYRIWCYYEMLQKTEEKDSEE